MLDGRFHLIGGFYDLKKPSSPLKCGAFGSVEVNRAKNAFHECDYSIGQEDGFMMVPRTRTGYLEVTCCAVYDSRRFAVGLSSGVEYPQNVMDMILKEGKEAGVAVREAGLREGTDPAVDDITILTSGKITYYELAGQALKSALSQL